MIADRFTGWNTIVSNPHGKFDGQHLVSNMRDLCATWNILEHITTDGGPQMNWIKDWDITHRPSSAYFLHIKGCCQKTSLLEILFLRFLQWPFRSVRSTGVIMEVKPHEQIMIKVDESRRLTLRTGDSYANWILERPV